MEQYVWVVSLHVCLRGWPASRERRGLCFDEMFCPATLRPSDAQNDGRYYDTVCISEVKRRNENLIHRCERMNKPRDTLIFLDVLFLIFDQRNRLCVRFCLNQPDQNI